MLWSCPQPQDVLLAEWSQQQEILENALPNSSQPESAKPTPVKPTKKSNLPDRSDKKKPSSPSDPKPAKRRKVSEKQEPEDAVGEDEGLAEPEDRPAKANGKPRSRTKTSESLLSDVPDVGEDNLKPDAEATPLGQGSESDLSDVIDDGPKPKGRKRRPGPGEATSKAPKKKKAAQKPQDADPDAEEIKRLQGWLIKCGIRKMWYKELAPYDTPKAKIRHLKEMLAEAGMTGRYSQEKATEIKEARELKADLEAVQDGAKLWGKGESEEEEQEEGQSRPKRRLARGLQSLDFLNDDDGEETD